MKWRILGERKGYMEAASYDIGQSFRIGQADKEEGMAAMLWLITGESGIRKPEKLITDRLADE